MRYPPALAWSLLLASPAFARLHRHLSQHQTTNHHRRLHPRSFAPLLVQPEQSLEVHPRSQTVADLIDDPSIFERTLAAEAEELERRQLAAQEDWYGEASVPEQSIPAAQMLESPEQRQDTPIQDWEEDTHRYTFLASHPPPSDLDDPEHPVRPETIKNFAHHNAVGGDEDEDERVNQALEDGEDEEYDLNTIGEDEDYDLETIWDETDEYFLVEGDSEEGEFYRVKRSLDPRTSKGRKSSKKGRKQTKSKQKKLSQQQGMLGYSDKRAGPSGATSKTTKRSGPNGSQAWLNNGISKSKKTGRWSPPKLKLSQLKTVSLTNALKSPSSPYHACKRFLPLFNESAKRHSLPPILLAALAMQESSCNPDTRGGGGEHGLMQLIKENCRGRDSAACMEPKFNIETAAALFANNLKTAGGDILVALAAYNGWYRGMSYKSATQAARSSCCRCQQNLDYLHQMLNGWLLNISPYEHRLGLLRNLDVCGP